MAAVIRIELKVPDIPLFREGAAAKIVHEEMTAAMHAATIDVVGGVSPLVPVNLGHLRGSLQSEVSGTPVSITGRVFFVSPYALPVENGTRPHWPPVGPLRLWAQRRFSVSGSEAASIAFLVARKISRVGTKGVHMMERGWNAVRGTVSGRFDTALARIASRLGGR